jgi:succinyl-CoA synthetase beta subunit
VDALLDLCLGLAKLFEVGRYSVLELNPVLVTGTHAIALDAAMTLDEDQTASYHD